MSLPRSTVHRGPLIVLMVVVAFVLALLIWWIVYQVREVNTSRVRAEARLQASTTAVVELLNAGREPVDPGEIVDRLFPGLTYRPGDGARGERDLQRRPLRDGEIVVDVTQIGIEDERSRAMVRMFMAEGVVFIAAQLLGVFIVYGALRREVRLKRQQENFISAVTHELKSPLTSLDLFIQTVKAHDLPPERQRDILIKMEKDTQRLTELVNNLLDAARAISGRFSPEPEPVDLGEYVASAVDRMRAGLESARVKLEVTTPEGTRVRADRRYLESILRNLVQNAVKYSEREPVIRISTLRNGRNGILEVADDGLGLSKADEERIFEKFYRVGDEMVRRAPGSGLGLYLSREMVRSMGGSISARSSGPGQGTTMRVLLPLVEA